jgi:hypothetical protein
MGNEGSYGGTKQDVLVQEQITYLIFVIHMDGNRMLRI